MDQLNLALGNQAIPGYEDFKIGEILSLRGWVKQDTCDFFVTRWPDILTSLSVSQRQKIGFYLLEAHLLTPEQKIKILEIQQQNNALFGHIAATQGFVKQQTVDFFVKQLMQPTPGKSQPFLQTVDHIAPGKTQPQQQKPAVQESALKRAERYCKLQEFQNATIELRELLLRNDNNPKAHALLARIYQQRRQGSLAKVHLKKALAIAPNDLYVQDTKQRLFKYVSRKNKTALTSNG